MSDLTSQGGAFSPLPTREFFSKLIVSCLVRTHQPELSSTHSSNRFCGTGAWAMLPLSVQFSPLTDLVVGEDLRNDPVFESFLQEALISSPGMGRDVHSLMLSIQFFLYPPSPLLISTLPVHSPAFFQNLSQVFPVSAVANTGSCVGPQNKIGQLLVATDN